MKGIEELYKILIKSGIDADAIELAESLWLSKFIPKTKTKIDSYIQKNIDKSSDILSPNEEIISSEEKNDFNKNIIKGKKNSKQKLKDAPLYPTNNYQEENALPLRTPSVRKLYKDNNLIYSFRHFKQKIISTKQKILDEEKIAEYIIKTNSFKPFYKKSYEKRFNILFIVDISENMKIWENLIDNFIKDVRNYHIFKNVSVHYIFTDDKIPVIYKK